MKVGDLVRWSPPPGEAWTEDPDTGIIGIIIEIESGLAPSWLMSYVVLWSDGTTGRGLRVEQLAQVNTNERG